MAEIVFRLFLSSDYVLEVPRGAPAPVPKIMSAAAPSLKIPTEVDITAWPAPPAVPCWGCTISLKNDVWFIPQNIIRFKPLCFTPLGCFHSLPCLYEYMRRHPELSGYEDNVRTMIVAKVGIAPLRIIRPPNACELLSKFGRGTMSEEEYRIEVQRVQGEMFWRSTAPGEQPNGFLTT